MCKALGGLRSEKRLQFSSTSFCWPKQVAWPVQMQEGGRHSIAGGVILRG